MGVPLISKADVQDRSINPGERNRVAAMEDCRMMSLERDLIVIAEKYIAGFDIQFNTTIDMKQSRSTIWRGTGASWRSETGRDA